MFCTAIVASLWLGKLSWLHPTLLGYARQYALMHYLIEFAHVGSEGCAQALAGLQLPHLNQLLQRMRLNSAEDMSDVAMGLWAGDGKTPWLGEYTLSPPHERARAGALGIWTADGEIAWAAHTISQSLQLAQNFGYQAGQAWAQITPCFWHVGVDQIQMLHPDGLQLIEADSRTVLEAVRPYFAEDGITLHYHSPTCWYAHGPLFEGLATASLDRVVGRNVNAWMPEGAQAAPLRRLQNEMQMLLYTHPVNDARQAAGQLAVNSFWVSGAGALPAAVSKPTVEMTVLSPLRTPALHENWTEWAAQWQLLDSTVLKDAYAQMQRGQSISLTLCGEKAAQHWCSQKPSVKSFFTNLLPSQSKHLLLKQL